MSFTHFLFLFLGENSRGVVMWCFFVRCGKVSCRNFSIPSLVRKDRLTSASLAASVMAAWSAGGIEANSIVGLRLMRTVDYSPKGLAMLKSPMLSVIGSPHLRLGTLDQGTGGGRIPHPLGTPPRSPPGGHPRG